MKAIEQIIDALAIHFNKNKVNKINLSNLIKIKFDSNQINQTKIFQKPS